MSVAARLSAGRPVLAFSPHPLQASRDREIIYAEFQPGETITAYLKRSGIWARLPRHSVLLTIDGRLMPRELWAHCRPKPGTLINIYAVVRGGGGKKNPLAIIAMIALTIVTAGAGAAIAGAIGLEGAALTIGGALIQGAIAVVGGMAINAIFPPPKPAMSQAQALTSADSPTYAISGAQNRMRPYQPMPRIMGTHRVVPDLGANPYSEFEGEDQYVYLVFDFGHNPDAILGSHKFGQTPVESITGVTLQESGPDGALSLFPANVDSVEGMALEPDAYVERNTSPNTTAIAVEITGLLLAIDTTTGETAPAQCALEMEYRAVGAADWLPFWTDKGATVWTDGSNAFVAEGVTETDSSYMLRNSNRKPLRYTFKISVPEGQYSVRIRRTSPANPNQNITKEIAWSQLRSYQPDSGDYTGRKRIAAKVKASSMSQGMLAEFNCIVRGRCQVWNGSIWALGETSNPAWWFLDWARGSFVNGRRVWGAGFADSRIDIEGIKVWGAWCTTQGLSFNGVFDQPASVQDIASAVALMGRATVSWATGKFGAVWDAEDQPTVAVFGAQNILPASFEVEYSGGELAEEILGWFINPEIGWKRDSVRAPVPGATGNSRVREVQWFGCTNRDLCAQLTNLMAANNAYRARRYRWRCDFEGMTVSRGDVIELPANVGTLDYSGRFKEGGSASTIKLARKVPLSQSGSHITIVKPDATFSTHAIAGGTGMTDTLSLLEPLAFNPWADAEHPCYDYKFNYGATTTFGRKVKIESLKPADGRSLQISAIPELPEFYAAKNNPVVYVPPRPVFGGVSVSNLQLSVDGVRAGTGYLAKVIVTWDTGPDFGSANVRAKVDDGPMQLIAQDLRSRSFEFTVGDGSTVEIELTGYSSLGGLGAVTVLTQALEVDFASLSPPIAPPWFSIDGDVFKWGLSPSVDVIGYRIRFHYGDRRTIADAAPLHDGLITETPWQPAARPAGPLTFFLTAVDAAGLESTPLIIVTDLGDPAIANVIEEVDLQALGFPGTIEGGTIDAGDLVADDTEAFYVPDDGAPFYAASDAAPFYVTAEYAKMTYTTGDIAPAGPLAGSVLTIDAEIAGAPVQIEYRASGASPMYADDDGDAFYSEDDSDPFYDAAPDWTPWPGQLVVTGQPYQFRFSTGQGGVQGVISRLRLVIDAPDIEEELDDVEIDVGGTRLALTRPFSVVKNIQFTLQDDGGDAVGVKIIDKDVDLGPMVKCVDGANAFVSGLVDARVKGY